MITNKQKIKKIKMKISYFITLFVGIAFAYFMWLTWLKLTEWIGNSLIVWGISGGIVALGILFSYFSVDKIAKKFI